MPKQFIIAIVDDDRHVRLGLEDLIRSIGYAAISFVSAEEFLRSGILYNGLCLICDMDLPGMSGADLQEVLLDDGHRIPMIFMGSADDARIRDRVMRKGACGFLQKPFEERLLLEYLERMTKKPR